MKKNIYCVFDTETIGIDKKWIYDLGCVIMDKKGNIYHAERWIIDEVINLPNIEQMAYYGQKIKTFYKNMKTVPFFEAKQDFNNILINYEVNTICAYNLFFDMSAIRQTLQLTNIKGKFLTKNYNYFDIWNACCDSVFQQKTFRIVAQNEGWVSPAGNYRTNAEVAYRYITGNYNFIESHTALEDSYIEGVILQDILRQKKKIVKNQIIAHPWKKVQVA